MRQALRNPHFWIILFIMACGALFYYADQIPGIQDLVARVPAGLARYTTHRILSIIPVAYAAFVFGFRGGATTAVFISLALLPRAVFVTAERGEAHAEIVAFLFIGLLVSWLIDRQQKAVSRLEDARNELTDSLQTIRAQQQQLVSLYAISTSVYRTLDVQEIARDGLKEALQVTGAEIGWIYLQDDESGDLVLSAHRGVSPEFVDTQGRIKRGEGLDGQVFEAGQPKSMEAVAPEFSLRLSAGDGVGAILVAPLRTRVATRGTLGIAMGNEQPEISSKLELLAAVGDAIGIAIGHARLTHKERTVAKQLQFSEQLYRGLFESSSEAIIVCSSVARIISVNRACEKLTGYSSEELSNSSIYRLFSATSLDVIERLFSVGSEGGTAEEAKELRLIRKDGTEAYVELRVSPLLAGYRSMGLQAILRDVTEERQLRQNMQYYVSQITRAQENERLRISRELHDDTAQVLVSLSRELDSLIADKSKLPKAVVERLKGLHDTTDSVLEGVRRFSQDLRPSILDDLGLMPALEWLASDLENRYGIETKVTASGEQRRLPPDKELAVFRIAQEALGNIGRHSRASRAEISIDFDKDALTLVISDDGQGFDMPQRPSDLVQWGKLGIVGMRERARLIGGTLIVQSAPGKGTTVTLRAPA